MKNELKKAKIIGSGLIIEVYKSKERGTWIDYSDCKTEYYSRMLDFKQ